MQLYELKKLLEIKRPTHIEGPNDFSKSLAQALPFEIFQKALGHTEWERVSFTAFEEGVPRPVHKKTIERCLEDESFSHLPSSVRITNVQMLSSPIEELCQKFWKEHQMSFSCNLYVTPRKGNQCFDYHSDPQVSLIYQLTGEKIWHFPLDDTGDFLQDTHIALLNSKNLREKGEELRQEFIRIKKGELISVPYGLCHFAKNDKESVSAHLTFSCEGVSLGNFSEIFFSKALGLEGFKSNQYQRADFESAIELLRSEFDKEKLKRAIEEEIKEQELELITKGRPY